MIPRFCECGHDNTINGTGHCRVHHKDYPVLNGGEGCPDCKAERKPLEDRFDELARQLKTVEQKGMEYLRVENEQLRARITELTQCDPSWYDMSVADAFRMWKADREELEKVRAENANLRASLRGRTMYHSDEAVNAEMGKLRAEVERLKGEVEGLKEELDLTEHANRCHQASAQPVYEALLKAESALTRCRNEALEEAFTAGAIFGWDACENNWQEDGYESRKAEALRALKTSPPKADEPQPATAPETNED